MADIDFARCPKRSATCPTPSYCQPTCRHTQDWLKKLELGETTVQDMPKKER